MANAESNDFDDGSHLSFFFPLHFLVCELDQVQYAFVTDSSSNLEKSIQSSNEATQVEKWRRMKSEALASSIRFRAQYAPCLLLECRISFLRSCLDLIVFKFY